MSSIPSTWRLEPVSESVRTEALRVLRQLRPQADWQALIHLRDSEGVVFEVAMDGRDCVAVLGYRFLTTLARGYHVHLHDFVVDEARRSQGLGGEVLERFLTNVRAAGASWVFLDSVPRAISFYSAHRFERHSSTLVKRQLVDD